MHITLLFHFFFQAEDGIRYPNVTGVQTCALPIWLLALRRAGRRLGRLHRLAPGLRLSRTPDRHSLEPPRDPPRSQDAAQPHWRRKAVSRRAQPLAEGRDRLSMDPGHQAPDPRLWPRRFARGPGRLDRREVPQLERLRRGDRERDPPRRPARQHFALLAQRRDRLVLLALLRPRPSPLADPRGQDRRRADRLCGISEGGPEAAAVPGRQDLYEHPSLDRNEKGRPFRRPRTAAGSRRGSDRVLPFSEPVAYSHREHVGVSLAGIVAADLRVTVPPGLGEDGAVDVVDRSGAEQQAGSGVGGIADRDCAGGRARLEIGLGAREARLPVDRPLLLQRQDADARERERVRLVLAADRVGRRARRRGAVVELTQARIRALDGEVPVHEVADVEAKPRVAAVVAARGADALVRERVVEIAAAQT